MRAVVTRVSAASVRIAGECVAEIGAGLLILLGVGRDDAPSSADALAKKIYELRIFADAGGAMNRSIADSGGSLLVVSQFTLYGDVRHGRRPSFVAAAPPEEGRALYDRFVLTLRSFGQPVETGRFGATMAVASINDGPVTLLLDTAKQF